MIDFNNAESQNSFDLIPSNTIAKARLVLKAGNDPSDHFITRSKGGDTAYLNCEFIILEGKYAKRKIFDKIGLLKVLIDGRIWGKRASGRFLNQPRELIRKTCLKSR